MVRCSPSSGASAIAFPCETATVEFEVPKSMPQKRRGGALVLTVKMKLSAARESGECADYAKRVGLASTFKHTMSFRGVRQREPGIQTTIALEYGYRLAASLRPG